MQEAITVYKLIILYTLNRVDSPLTLGLISDYIIDHGYTNYFNVQNAFADLLDADLISCDQTYNAAFYKITETGKETLKLFYTDLSYEIRSEIDEYLRDNRCQIIDRTAITSDYTRRENGDYVAHCSVVENNELLFELKLSVPSEQDARKLCNNWKTGSGELYSEAVKILLN